MKAEFCNTKYRLELGEKHYWASLSLCEVAMLQLGAQWKLSGCLLLTLIGEESGLFVMTIS